jgi:thiamine-phosphate pyrophosphorylase
VHFLRIIDVNLNRLDESLKIIEDIARFHLESGNLLSRTRKIRRVFLDLKRSLPMEAIIGARQSHLDLGRKAEFDSRTKKSTTATILSNLTRAREAARTIEETLKTIDTRLSSRMKEIRFQIYDIERDMVIQIEKRFDPFLHAIIDEQYLQSRNIDWLVKTLANNGATMIQLRATQMSDRNFMWYATQVRSAIRGSDAKFIINNRLDIALACNAHGVHLGQDDIPLERAREIMGDMAIIGISAHNLTEARKAERAGADYLGVGAVFPTTTKANARVCGLQTLRRICRVVKIPIIGIGGVNDQNYSAILRAGAAGIAVASYLFEGNVKKRIRSLTRR